MYSFSQQLAHSASAFKQISYCLMFARGSWQIQTDRSIVRTSCAAIINIFWNNNVSNDNVRTMRQCERGTQTPFGFTELYSEFQLTVKQSGPQLYSFILSLIALFLASAGNCFQSQSSQNLLYTACSTPNSRQTQLETS